MGANLVSLTDVAATLYTQTTQPTFKQVWHQPTSHSSCDSVHTATNQQPHTC